MTADEKVSPGLIEVQVTTTGTILLVTHVDGEDVFVLEPSQVLELAEELIDALDDALPLRAAAKARELQ